MTIPFVKMHGAANDFVVIDHRAPFLPDERERLVAKLCDRRRGIGADGLLLLERDPELDFAMRYYNADGRPATYCGNGARCLARFALDLGLGAAGGVRFRTEAGVQRARRGAATGAIEVAFGAVARPARPVSIEAAGRTFDVTLVQAGVPHAVVEVERVEWAPLEEWGPALRHHEHFAPAGANVDVVARLAPSRVAMRTYERGVEAETLACGSGAIASALWATLQGDDSPITILTAGGDELRATLAAAGDGWDVSLEGPAEVAYEGTWRDVLSAGAPDAARTGARSNGS